MLNDIRHLDQEVLCFIIIIFFGQSLILVCMWLNCRSQKRRVTHLFCYKFSPFENIFLERIMSDALEEHDGNVSIGDINAMYYQSTVCR